MNPSSEKHILSSRWMIIGLFITLSLFASILFASKWLFLLSAFALFFYIGAPLFLLFALITIFCFFFFLDGYQEIASYDLFVDNIFSFTDRNVLLAIPFFIISGAIMSRGQIAQKLIASATELVGWLPGGLGYVAIFACVFFAAISGSSPVTLIAIGTMMYPALIQAKYKEDYTIGVLTTAGSLGILIPPSIPMIIYAIVVSGITTLDIGHLFLAGVLPGIYIAILLGIHSFIVNRDKTSSNLKVFIPVLLPLIILVITTWLFLSNAIGYTIAIILVLLSIVIFFFLSPIKMRNLLSVLQDSIWALMLPVLILGGIYSGVFTATEAAAISVVYALWVEIYIHKQVKWKDLVNIFSESLLMVGSIILIMVVAFTFNKFMVVEELPQKAIELIKEMHLSKEMFLLILNILLLIAGCFMDEISAILIIAPMIVPVALSLGIDPIHLGIIFIVNLQLGYLTPPIGLNLFVAAALFKKPFGTITKATVPFWIAMLIGVVTVTYFEPLSLGLIPKKETAHQSDSDTKSPMPDDTNNKPTSGVKSLQELMKESQNKPTVTATRVKSLQELMQEAEEKQPASE